MNTHLIFVAQIGSIITFIVGLFVLYRLLVQNKEATIEFLQQRIEHLNERIQGQGADALSENLARRINLLTDEIGRLNQDKETNSTLIKAKEDELDQAKSMYERLQKLIMHSSGMSVSFFCPKCDEPTIESAEAKVVFGDRKKDTFLVKYRCGYSEINGRKHTDCRRLEQRL